jgi:tRNA (guanine37-N1)-methyltransferase
VSGPVSSASSNVIDGSCGRFAAGASVISAAPQRIAGTQASARPGDDAGVRVQQQADVPGHLVMLTPGGRRLDQAGVEELARKQRIVLVCGRYEGFDDRVRETLQPDEISIGDYVLSGGEVAAMVIVDAVARLLPGVLGDEESARQDSFSGADRLVEGPQYTRPREFRGLRVPDVLLSGDHGRIATWRHEQAVDATRRRVPANLSLSLSPKLSRNPSPERS